MNTRLLLSDILGNFEICGNMEILMCLHFFLLKTDATYLYFTDKFINGLLLKSLDVTTYVDYS